MRVLCCTDCGARLGVVDGVSAWLVHGLDDEGAEMHALVPITAAGAMALVLLSVGQRTEVGRGDGQKS